MTEEVLAEMGVGPRAIGAYSRLSYTMWYALAEFIDNSTQSRLNYGSLIDDVLKSEGTPLVVTITYNRIRREIEIADNSIGMTKDKLVDALQVAVPTKDSVGRSKYGMGLKTAACWIGKRWKVVTCEWGSGEEWTADVNVDSIVNEGGKVRLTPRAVPKDAHYTKVIISDLQRNIQKRTEETIKVYLGSMYRFDLQEGSLQIAFNNDPIALPDDREMDTDPSGAPMRLEIPETTLVDGKKVRGWVAVLKKGGRKYGGFSIFQNKRQIQGFPNAWKPKSIFGGVDDEGANNLVAQRLTGVIELQGFEVSHTKDAILFQGDEEEELEKLLYKLTKDYQDYAQKRRKGERGNPWSREKVKDLLEGMRSEFQSSEMQDVVNHAILPPIEAITANNRQIVNALAPDDRVMEFEVVPDLKVIVSLHEVSEFEPHVTIATAAAPGTIHVIVNGLHPYYAALESTDALDECLRQYVYDAIAEYRVSKLTQRLNPDSIRRFKNELLRVKAVRIENAASEERDNARDALHGDLFK
jgi:hypothetical protein